VADRLGLVPPVVEQTSYSMLLRERVEVALAGLYPGLGVMAYSPLAGGALTGAKPALEAEAGAARIVRGLRPIAAMLECSVAQLALAWTIRSADVSTALFGASSLAQLEDNLGALVVLPRLGGTVALEIEGVLQNDPRPGAVGDPRFSTDFRSSAAPLAKL
jgi:aryl-alcohol dehydrogenase-like predicted oxidoreductase